MSKQKVAIIQGDKVIAWADTPEEARQHAKAYKDARVLDGRRPSRPRTAKTENPTPTASKPEPKTKPAASATDKPSRKSAPSGGFLITVTSGGKLRWRGAVGDWASKGATAAQVKRAQALEAGTSVTIGSGDNALKVYRDKPKDATLKRVPHKKK